MRFLARLIFTLLSNLVAIWIAANFIPGFEVSADIVRVLIAAGIFAFINIFIKPVFTTVLSPLAILSLGLSTLIINAGMIYLLDVLTPNVTINTIQALIYATLVISVINLSFHFSAKYLYKN